MMNRQTRSSVASTLRIAAGALVSGSNPADDALTVLQKVRDASTKTEKALSATEEALQASPDDRGIASAKAALSRSLASFKKREAAAAKAIRTAAKKGAPPALTKEAKKIERLLQSRLTDPSVLQVIPWAIPVAFEQGITEHQVVFRIPTDKLPKEMQRYWGKHRPFGKPLIMRTASPDVAARSSFEEARAVLLKVDQLLTKDTSGLNEGAYKNAATFVGDFVEHLQGWEGLKGEGEANVGRAQTAAALKSALNNGARRMGAYDRREATVNGLTVEVSYRSDLPKEGERAVGDRPYADMVENEISRAKKVFTPLLAPFRGQVKRVEFSDGEKSWIYVSVTLK